MIRPALPLLLALLIASPVAAGEGLGVGKETQAAIEKLQAGDVAGGRRDLESLVNAGDSDAAELLGEMLQFGGFGIKPDARAACRMFALSARDRADGRHNLALCFETGAGGKKDLAQAVKLYGEAGEMGYAQSWCAKGNLLIAGKGARKDVAEGVALCQRGAEGGSADAQTDLANFYLDGRLVPQDKDKAAHWYEKAAAQRQPNAAFVLAQMHWTGDGVAKDRERSVKLWTVAYEEGRLDAAYWIGLEAADRAFDKGPPAKVDAEALAAGIRWLEIASREDYDPRKRKHAASVLDALRDLDAAVKKRKKVS